jgi:hypothetical protein
MKQEQIQLRKQRGCVVIQEMHELGIEAIFCVESQASV